MLQPRTALAGILLTGVAVSQSFPDRDLRAPVPAPKTPKVLILGLDGFRPSALSVAETPELDALIADGAFSDLARVGPNTWSGPGWSAMLTGAWSDRHGVTDNSFSGANFGEYPALFTRVEGALASVDTASLVSWQPIQDFIVTGADYEFFQDYTEDGDVLVTAEAVRILAEEDPDVLFVYYADIDVAGHTWGFSPTVPQYVAEIEEVDGQLGQVLDALRARPSYPGEDWLILVSTDHGGSGTSHGQDIVAHRKIFYIASGPSTHQGFLHTVPNVVDLAVTALVHMGVSIDPAWNLDGRPMGFPFGTHFGENLIFNGTADHSSGNTDFLPDRGIPGWKDVGNLTVISYGVGFGFPDSGDPGPPERGASFFSGGSGAADDEAVLTVDIADVAAQTDLEALDFVLLGWLGGYAEQEDRASLTAEFLDETGSVLTATQIGPVTLAHRQAEIGGAGEALTGLLFRSAVGTLPAGTRRVRFRLLAEHFAGGGTDGYADSLSFVLTPTTLTAGLSCAADVTSASLAEGGIQTLHFDAGPEAAGARYRLLGSATGTRPGARAGALHLPLNRGPYLEHTLRHPDRLPLEGALGRLDASGRARARVLVHAGSPAILVGRTLHHAFVLENARGGTSLVSDPLPLFLVP